MAYGHIKFVCKVLEEANIHVIVIHYDALYMVMLFIECFCENMGSTSTGVARDYAMLHNNRIHESTPVMTFYGHFKAVVCHNELRREI